MGIRREVKAALWAGSRTAGLTARRPRRLRRRLSGLAKICQSHPWSFIMSDDKSQSHGQDRERINVNQEYELRDWAKSLNTTPERVKEAVQAVGDRVEKVREFLRQDKPR